MGVPVWGGEGPPEAPEPALSAGRERGLLSQGRAEQSWGGGGEAGAGGRGCRETPETCRPWTDLDRGREGRRYEAPLPRAHPPRSGAAWGPAGLRSSPLPFLFLRKQQKANSLPSPHGPINPRPCPRDPGGAAAPHPRAQREKEMSCFRMRRKRGGGERVRFIVSLSFSKALFPGRQGPPQPLP